MDKKKLAEKYRKAWEEKPVATSNNIKEASWNKFQSKAFPTKKRIKMPWRYAAAAILIISLSAGSLFVYQNTQQDIYKIAENVIENPTSEWKTIILPDSSKVELSANSKLVYATDFVHNRKIELNGEGFFKVKKDKEHPFQVVCNETTTTVLGTSFTVREDLKDGVSVKLYEGSVQMSVKDSAQNWLLAPGEKFIYNKQTVSIEAFNRFVDFDNEKFVNVVQYIEDGYHYKITIPEVYLNKRITLRINKKEDITTIVKLLSKLHNLNYEINESLKQITFQ
ncbi:FecR family protein [Galbibacter orientalis]|uniref:FecR family protein n=1 Tax=Galbibacter orientalis TaxID=453852 RepID=UPI00308059F1